MLRITPEVCDAMFAHAIAGLPNEACGMFSGQGKGEIVDAFHPMRNAADSATLFALDGQELLDLERSIDTAGRSIVGVMHSHTTTSAYPSPTDVSDSARFDPSGLFHHMIVSLRDAEPSLRCYTILGDDINEVPVEIFDGEPDVHDDSGTAVAAVMQLPPC